MSEIEQMPLTENSWVNDGLTPHGRRITALWDKVNEDCGGNLDMGVLLHQPHARRRTAE